MEITVELLSAHRLMTLGFIAPKHIERGDHDGAAGAGPVSAPEVPTSA